MKTNKCVIHSRQLDNGLRQVNVLAQDKLLVPLDKNIRVKRRPQPSWLTGGEGGRGARQRWARPCRGRDGRMLWYRVRIRLTWIVLCQCLVWWTCAMCSVWNGSLHLEIPLSTPRNSSLCMLDLWYLWKSVRIYWISLCALLRCFSQLGMWAHTDGWFLCDCQWSQYLVSVESDRAQGELSRPLVLYALASHCRQCTVHQQSWQCSWWCSCGARWTCHCQCLSERRFFPSEGLTGFVKGIVHNFFYFRSELIFWIVMGCGIADFGRRGLKTPQTQDFWVFILSPGTSTRGATWDLD